MSHRLLSASAALLGSTSTAAATAAAPAIAPAAPAAPAAAAPAGDPVTDVVSVADARAVVAQAATDAATAERTRTAAVFASEAGKAHPQMAAFMLNSNPTATADSIVAQLAAMPAGAATAAPAAPAATAPAAGTVPAVVTPPGTQSPGATMTVPLTQTPIIQPGTEANTGEAEPKVDADKFWDTQMSTASASITHPFGGEIAPGIPRTGN